jgi:hypothetical protein
MAKVNFICKNKEIYDLLEKPYPAEKKYPEWLKNMPSYISNNKIDNEGNPLSTVKKCMPFHDALASGYHIPLPCDVWIENNLQGKIKIKWSSPDFEMVNTHIPAQYTNYPIPLGFNNSVFKWLNQWIIQTPKNYSCLFTHPIHYDDLPFKSLTAIVDTDKFPEIINFPFFIKNDFEGLIPKGTPLIQIIPFKRDSYVATYSTSSFKLEREWAKAKTVFFDRYKKFFRTPKEYTQQENKCPFSKLLR